MQHRTQNSDGLAGLRFDPDTGERLHNGQDVNMRTSIRAPLMDDRGIAARHRQSRSNDDLGYIAEGLKRPKQEGILARLDSWYRHSPLQPLWYKYGVMVPGANLVFAPDDEAPSLEDVNLLLELLTLLNALLLCWVVALPSSVDYDGLIAADDRVKAGGAESSYIRCMPFADYDALGMELPSQMYAYTSAVAAGFVALNVVTLILTVAYLVCSISGDPCDAELDMQNWWKWGKYAVLILVGGTATGFLWCVQVLLVFVVINYPNEYIADDWDGSCSVGGFFHTNDYRNSWQVFRAMFNWVYPGVCVCVCTIGYSALGITYLLYKNAVCF
jgi:hypothetical protein